MVANLDGFRLHARMAPNPNSSAPHGTHKEVPNRIVLPLSDELLAGIEAARREDEDRLTLIRSLIERGLDR